jgi:hypothetical protein
MLLSESLGVTPAQLWKFGVFDTYLGIDSLLHVDPARLRSTRIPELRGAYKRFHTYFDQILDLIVAGEALRKQTIKKLIFPEIQEAALGYAKTSTSGRGVTIEIATRLYETAKAIINVGIKNHSIFEVAVLFEEKFGPDLISDMTVFLLLDELSQFNKRVAEKLGLPTVTKTVHGKTITFVFCKKENKSVLLIPNSILADLPLATDWSEIDAVCEYNESIRKRLNKIIQDTWTKRMVAMPKSLIKQALLNNPILLKELLTNYAKAKAEPYDFESDPRGIVIWHKTSREYAKKNPLELKPAKSTDEVYDVVQKICHHFKHLIEEKGLHDLLFDSDGRPKIEKASQLLFFGIADAYCSSNNLDINREPQTGRGPADFKVSRGYHERVIVEVKLSSSGKYLDGLTAQLPTYLKAEKAKHGILLLMRVGEHDKKLQRIKRVHKSLKKSGKAVPDLLIVDALDKLSASKLKGLSEADWKFPELDFSSLISESNVKG